MKSLDQWLDGFLDVFWCGVWHSALDSKNADHTESYRVFVHFVDLGFVTRTHLSALTRQLGGLTDVEDSQHVGYGHTPCKEFTFRFQVQPLMTRMHRGRLIGSLIHVC